jgi:osmoprotectant transport system ATP-binding protein
MIEVRGLCKIYQGRRAVDDVSFTVPPGSITVLLGPSGCGKSTTLRMINRLIAPDAGTVLIDGQDTAAQPAPALRRRIGYAIQGVGLFPHWSVARNIATVPALLGWPRARIDARVAELLELLNLPPAEFAGKRPSELSGGQAQRVGVARALAADPALLLMDEPFGALDPITRRDLQREFRRIQRETGKTVVFVTHDLEEALLLGDRIVIMRQGRLVRDATPLELLTPPVDPYVQDFFGGAAITLHRLGLIAAASRAHPGPDPGGAALPPGATLRDALEAMLARHAGSITVQDAGIVTLADLLA